MTTLYKLTTADGYTRNDTLWAEGTTHAADLSEEPELCSSGVIHAYRHPLLAVIFNPIHAKIRDPILWEAEGDVVVDDGTKVGCRSLTTIKKIPLPVMMKDQRIRFAILVAKEVCDDPKWLAWADGWLSGADRSEASARAAAWAAEAAGAARAADAAAEAAWAARAADAAAGAGATAMEAAWAAEAAARAARAAAWAAECALRSNRAIDLVAIAERAIEQE